MKGKEREKKKEARKISTLLKYVGTTAQGAWMWICDS